MFQMVATFVSFKEPWLNTETTKHQKAKQLPGPGWLEPPRYLRPGVQLHQSCNLTRALGAFWPMFLVDVGRGATISQF